MKKSVLVGSVAAFGLLLVNQTAQAQVNIVNGGTYKFTHYGVVADASAAGFGVPAGTPLVLDVDRALPEPGTFINQWGDINNEAAQRFVLERQSDNSYKIRHAGTNLYLQPVGGAKVEGTRIEKNVSNDSDGQRWLITDPNNNGRLKFTLKNSSDAAGTAASMKVLEVGAGSPAPGGQVIIWFDNGFELAQRWTLTLMATPTATKNASKLVLNTEAYPNPLGQGDQLNLRVETISSGAADVEVLDVPGQRVHRQRAGLRAGSNTVQLTNSRLAAGLYVVRVRQGDVVQQAQVAQQ